MNPWPIVGAIIVAGGLIALAIFYSRGSFLPPLASTANVAGDTSPTGQVAVSVDDDPMLGDPSAPVTIIEFGDFQCPFCARLFQETLPQLKEQYVKTGKVRFVYRDFPLSSIHNLAQSSAEAAECADEQGKFWPYHDILYGRQDALSVDNFKRWAAELGLNTQEFNVCLDSGRYSAEVEKDYNDGIAAGVTGTPGTFINGRLVRGAVPFDDFKAIIEEELAKVQ